MDRKKLPYLYTGKAFSLEDRWCIVYLDEHGNRKKKYASINRHKTVKARVAAGNALLEEVRRKSSSKEHINKRIALEKELEMRKPIWKKTGYAAKASKLGIFLSWMDGRDWTPDTVKDFFWIHLVKERNLHATTFNDYYIFLNQCLGWIEQQHLLQKVQKRKAISTPARYYTNQQRLFLMEHFRKHDPLIWLNVQFVYYCFIRPRVELRFLKVGDIILDERKIIIPNDTAKNKKREAVAIPDAFYEIVAEAIDGQNPNKYIFSSKDDFTPYGKNTLGQRHQNILKSLNFNTKEYNVYSWKHTGAIAAVKAGIDLKSLQKQLRHKSLDDTDRYLCQLGVEDLDNLRKAFPSLTRKAKIKEFITVDRDKLLSVFGNEEILRAWLAT